MLPGLAVSIRLRDLSRVPPRFLLPASHAKVRSRVAIPSGENTSPAADSQFGLGHEPVGQCILQTIGLEMQPAAISLRLICSMGSSRFFATATLLVASVACE